MMADVVGLVVGVVSLGIQVSQGLISYYNEFRGQNEEIDSLGSNLDALRHTLLVLEALMGGDQQIVLQSADLVKTNIISTLGGISRLQNFLTKCRQHAVDGSAKPSSSASPAGPSNRSNQAKSLLNKVAFPFKRNTLNSMKAIVTDLQASLSLALSTLQL
jgi:ankyrin repeat domain-containing protein 50